MEGSSRSSRQIPLQISIYRYSFSLLKRYYRLFIVLGHVKCSKRNYRQQNNYTNILHILRVTLNRIDCLRA